MILIFDGQNVVTGMEPTFNRMAKKYADVAKNAYEEAKAEFPDDAEFKQPEPNWQEEGRKYLINAAYLLGNGTISVEENEVI